MVNSSTNNYRKVSHPLRRIEYSLALLLAGITLVSICQALYLCWPFTTDDAYISWHYAENFINGQGFRWHPGHNPIEGYSNFAWVIVSAAILKLGLPLIQTIKLFSTFCLFAALLCLYASVRKFVSPIVAVLPVYLFGHYHGLIWWTVSGLETSFYVALVFLVIWQTLQAFELTGNASGFSATPDLYSKSLDAANKSQHVGCRVMNCQQTLIIFHPINWWVACFSLTVAALTRFEGAIFAIVLAGFIVCLLCRHHLPARDLYKLITIALFAFFLPYLVYFLWRLLYFGHLFPNSYLCKVTADYYRFYLIHDYSVVAFPCLILSLPYLLSRLECRSILLGFPSLIYCLLLWRADPIIAHYNRLFLAALGLLSLMTVLGIHEFLNYFSYFRNPNALFLSKKPDFFKSTLQNSLASVLIVIVFTYFFIPDTDAATTQLEIEHYRQRVAIRLQVVTLLNQKAATNARVLLADCGLIPYFSRNDIEFIDSQCLNNQNLTSKEINLSYPKYAAYLQQVEKPDWVIRNYYPKTQSEDGLTRMMAENGFFTHYQLVTSYQSQQLGWKNGTIIQRNPDHVYLVYKRS